MEIVTITGKRGSWYADVGFANGTEKLPCLPKYFWKGRNHYVHPRTPRFAQEYSEHAKMIASIRKTGKVVIVNSDASLDSNGEPIGWTRKTGDEGYVGVFAADVVAFDENGFVLEFTERLANPKKK